MHVPIEHLNRDDEDDAHPMTDALPPWIAELPPDKRQLFIEATLTAISALQAGSPTEALIGMEGNLAEPVNAADAAADLIEAMAAISKRSSTGCLMPPSGVER